MQQSNGSFVVVEGPNKAGKSTFLPQLKGVFERLGRDVLLTREPGGTAYGEQLRSWLRVRPVSNYAAALGMNSARAEHCASVITPAVDRGQVVLSDRYLYSTCVFQCELKEMTPMQAASIDAVHRSMLVPDLVVFLMPDAKLLNVRLGEEADGHDIDVFESGARAELEAYESVIRSTENSGTSAVVLRYDVETQNSLIDQLMGADSFKRLASLLCRTVPLNSSGSCAKISA